MLLDTLRMQRRLREAGFPEEQADVLTEEVANIVTGELATKGDVSALRTELLQKFAETDSKIAEVRGEIAEVRGEIAEVKNEVADLKIGMAEHKTGIVRWIVGLVVAMLLGFGGMTIAMIVTMIRVAT